MDKATVDIYEERAGEWESRRAPGSLDRAQSLARRAGRGPMVDLGCGPGWYSAVLAPPVVALDASSAMLDLVALRAPGALRVQADLEALPLRRGSMAGGWARNSYVHLPRAALPLALADVHRALSVDAPLFLEVFTSDRERDGPFPGDDFPGRLFSFWSADHVVDVIEGAGFRVDRAAEQVRPTGERSLVVEATRALRLPDHVGPAMRLLACGLNPSIYAAEAGVGYARPGNRFWPAALEAGLASRDRDPRHALVHHGLGMTDLVHRPTVSAAELTVDEYREGLARLDRLVAWLEPAVVCFVGLAGWRAAVDRRARPGPQSTTVGGRPVYVMPNTSGLNAHCTAAGFADHLRAALTLASPPSPPSLEIA